MRKLRWAAQLLCATVLFLSPAVVFGQEHGGHGYSGGHGFSGGHGYSGGHGFSGGHGYSGGYGHGYDHGNHYYPRHHGNSFYFGLGTPYVYGPGYYAPNPCSQSGYYDQWGYWHPYPGCAAGPYPYPY